MPDAPDHPALRIENLRYRYPGSNDAGAAPARWTIDIAHLELGKAQQLLLTGSSGSGKSTLLHLIAGLFDPDEGRVQVCGQNVHALRGAPRDTFRGRHIGMIFQTFNLLHGFSALENVLAALMFSAVPTSEHEDRAMALLKELGVERVGARPENLSVGQQQRVAVARAIACGPALVLADEPTASLDPENAHNAMDLIQRTCANHKAALLCVSHDPSMTSRFERKASLHSLSASPPRSSP